MFEDENYNNQTVAAVEKRIQFGDGGDRTEEAYTTDAYKSEGQGHTSARETV